MVAHGRLSTERECPLRQWLLALGASEVFHLSPEVVTSRYLTLQTQTAFIDTALTAAAEVVRIRASFKYTPGCKTRQNRPSISLFRYSAKSTLGENFKLWGDFCVPCEEFKQHVFATEQGMIRCNHCSMLCLPGAFETPQWSVYDRKHWQPSGRRERNCRRSHKAIHTF